MSNRNRKKHNDISRLKMGSYALNELTTIPADSLEITDMQAIKTKMDQDMALSDGAWVPSHDITAIALNYQVAVPETDAEKTGTVTAFLPYSVYETACEAAMENMNEEIEQSWAAFLEEYPEALNELDEEDFDKEWEEDGTDDGDGYCNGPCVQNNGPEAMVAADAAFIAGALSQHLAERHKILPGPDTADMLTTSIANALEPYVAEMEEHIFDSLMDEYLEEETAMYEEAGVPKAPVIDITEQIRAKKEKEKKE